MQVGDVIAKRFRVERLVGSGGAAEVYAVFDPVTGAHLALKRLSVSASSAGVAEVMLAREYNALAQLSHPLIIRAYDYGKDGGVPYYTMELLSGENLRGLAPLEWRDACHVLRDVASALGIIHSRRLVHRDVTTRNVCRVADGRAKLIDFGALTPMGPIRDMVGTPPFVPPEAIDEQRLDGRADLFALGAVAYFLLTSEHAYPASTFRELGEAWRRPVNPPSAINPEVPPALDELVLSLLSLVKTARPRSAAEVFQRLTAIAGLPAVDSPEVARAYLATPSLVGRELSLARVQKHLTRLQNGKGSALLVEGESGRGRTRLLGAFLLEAKLRGYLALRASGRDSSGEPFHCMHELARSLVAADTAFPGDARGDDSALLARFLTEAPRSDEEWRVTAERFAAMFLRTAESMPLVLAIDDVDAADDASVMALTLLARRCRSLPLALVFTSQPLARRPALAELRRAVTVFVLEPFTNSETRVLVSSLFGDVPHVDGLAEWMHRLTEGNPRACLELAQHLVDSGAATYQEGAWALGNSIEGLGLPQTIDQALEARLGALSASARDFLQTLALMTEHDPLVVTEYPTLAGGEENLPRLFEALNELIAASLVTSAGNAYVVAHHELVKIARRSITEGAAGVLHRRLADAYASGSGADTVLVVYHLYHAGDRAAAFRVAVRAVTGRMDQAARGSGLARSSDGVKMTESLFVWGIENAMPRRDLVLLGRSLLQLASVADVSLIRHADLVLEPLIWETGLVYWDDLSDAPDPAARMQACLVRAFAAHQAKPECERGLGPAEAVAELATSVGMLIGVYAREFDAKRAAELAEVLEPLRSLSPAVDLIADVVQVTVKALRGHSVIDDRIRNNERLSQPIAGLDDLSRQGILHVALFYLSLEEASYGRESAAERIAPLDAYPHLAPLAWEVRMLLHLFRGETDKALLARRRRDAATIGRGDVDRHLDLSVIYEASASWLLGDLLTLERSLAVIGARATRSPGWMPYYHAFAGNYHALRGEAARALEHHQAAAALVPSPGEHAAWGLCTNSLAWTLMELDRAEEAEALLQNALSEASSVPVFSYVRAQLQMNVAYAKALRGDVEEATRWSRDAIEAMLACDVDGITMVEHHVKQALVALKTGDAETFQRAAGMVDTMARRVEGSSFAARHEFLMRQSRGAATFRPAAMPQTEIVTRKESHTTMMLGLRTELRKCRSAEERAARVLDILLEWSGTGEGFLYLLGPRRLALAASNTGVAPPDALEDRVNEWLAAFRAGDPVTASVPSFESDSGTIDDFDTVGIIAHRDDGATVAGVAVIRRLRPRRTIPQNVLSVLGDSLLAAGDAKGRTLFP